MENRQRARNAEPSSSNPAPACTPKALPILRPERISLPPINLRMSIGRSEFSFQCNGRTYAGATSAFELLGADSPNANSLTVRLLLRELGS